MVGDSAAGNAEFAQAPAAANNAPVLAQAEPKLAGGPPKNAMAGRRIIFRSHIELRVENLGASSDHLAKLVEQQSGYISKSNVAGTTGNSRSGTWTLRIPVGGYLKLIDSLKELGELVRQSSESQEVTAEFTDLQSRLVNKQKEEQRLLSHLDESTKNLEDIIRIEQEITRVRGEVELVQGRLRVLSDLTSLATITVTMSQVVAFESPVVLEAPTFVEQISSTWSGSLAELTRCGQELFLWIVGFGPWFVVCGLPLWLGYSLIRRRQRRLQVTPS